MRRKRKRKIKFKSTIKIFLIFVIFFLIIFPLTIKEKNDYDNSKKDSKKNIVKEMIYRLNNEDITDDFLYWVKDNYGEESLLMLDNKLNEQEYSHQLWHDIIGYSYFVLNDMYHKKYDSMDNIKIIDKKSDSNILSFVGDVSLADNWYIMPKYDERGKKVYGILSEDTVDVMTKSDIMIANSEFTVSDRGEKMTGKYYTFRASPKRLSIYYEMGVDLVTLANNHVYDYGRDAFYDMIDSFNEYKIPYIGAGKNIDEAKRPYYFIINGYKIAFVNATRAEKLILTPEATQTDGGVFRCYDPTNFINVINEVKRESDYVIALIHFGKEDSHELEKVQVETSKLYIDAGADCIVGSHAHVLQGIEFYKNKPIIYNLGDFIFNNETKDTGIFQIKLYRDGSMDYYFLPAYESNEYTKLLESDEKQRVINEMNSWSINARISEDGKIEEIN